MKEVVVTASRPLIEVKADKTIMNVEGTINAVDQICWNCCANRQE